MSEAKITDAQLAEIQHDLDTRQQMNLTEAAQIFAGHTRSLLAEVDRLSGVVQLNHAGADYAEEMLGKQADRIRQLERERDLAIAHDRQPYPTADAYERACAALEKHRQRANALHGSAVTLLGLCDGLKRFEDYDPATAHVTVREIERIFEGFDRGRSVPVESAPTAKGIDHG